MPLLERYQEAGDAIDDDFLDAPDGTRHDGRSTGHGFEIDDPERFVDGRATEDRGVRIQFDRLLLGDHLLNPDHVVETFMANVPDRGFHLREHLPGIGCAGTEHDLSCGVDVLDRIHQMDDAFLARDPANEKNDRLLWIDAVFFQCGRVLGWMVLLDIDAVVDHRNLRRVDVEMRQDVVLGSLRDGNDRIGHTE